MKKNKDTKRIWRWSHDHKNDKKYRKAQAEGSRRYQEQLYRDAAFGRIARTLLTKFGELFKKLVEKEEEVDRAAYKVLRAKETAEGRAESKGVKA